MLKKPFIFASLVSCAALFAMPAQADEHEHDHEGHEHEMGETHAHDHDHGAPQFPPDMVIATVNGAQLTYQQFLEYQQVRSGKSADALLPLKEQQQYLDELINRELVIQDALKKGLDKDPQLLEQLESLKRTLLTEIAVKKHLQENPPTKEDVQAEYDKRLVAAGRPTEYQASHILLETEEEAKAVIKALQEGAAFEELAKQKSKDTMTGPKGGDLGWFAHGQMVKEFSEAVASLEIGKFSTEPAQSKFGWHVILLKDKRDVPPPKLEQVEDRLAEHVRQRKVSDYLLSLQKDAKIEPNQEFPPAASADVPPPGDVEAAPEAEAKP